MWLFFLKHNVLGSKNVHTHMLIAALSTEWWEKNKSASSEFSTLSSTLFLCFDDPFTIAGSHTSASLQHFFPTRFALLCRVLSRLKRKTFLFSFRDRTQSIIGSRSPWKWWNKLFSLSLSSLVRMKSGSRIKSWQDFLISSAGPHGRDMLCRLYRRKYAQFLVITVIVRTKKLEQLCNDRNRKVQWDGNFHEPRGSHDRLKLMKALLE